MSASVPYISIVATGRNDGYGRDFVGRFMRTLRFNARQLDDRGVAWEMIARGIFVLTTNVDVYLGRDVFAVLARKGLQPGVVYRARRIDLTLGMDESTMDWDVVEDDRNYRVVASTIEMVDGESL